MHRHDEPAIHKTTDLTLLTAVAATVMLLLVRPGLADEKSPPIPAPLQVFVLAGQSNMAGAGRAKELPPEFQGAQENVLIFGEKGWEPLKPAGGMGPEVAFGRAMAEALGRPTGIIKFAVPGASLVYDWHPDVPKNYYQALREKVESARKSRPLEIVGMVWMQGERDSRYPGAAAKYAANLEALIRAARRDYQAPHMAFVLGRVNPPAGKYPHVAIVRKAQERVSLPATAWVDCDDLAKHNDNVHYNTRGQIELGKRFAKAALKLMEKESGGAVPSRVAK